MASCSTSLALSRGRVLPLHATGRRLHLEPRGVSLRLKPRRMNVVMCSESDSSSNGVAAAQPKRKRGRPKKVKTSSEDEEEEWDFFGELAQHMANGGGASSEEEDDVDNSTVAPANVVDGGSSVPETAASSSSFREEEQTSRKENIDDEDDDDDINLDDPKYQQKPDWMEDEVWQSINNELKNDGEGQPLWVDEDDPTWPAEEPEDGWGFRTSQFFDKVSIKSEKNDDDDDDEELKMNWESEADDWTIQEITSDDWELTAFHNPSPLVVYVFARYGRRGLDSWKTLTQLEKAVTKIWESNKAPLRAVKVDVGMEVDMGSALGIGKDDCPQLLFIKNGKGLYRLKEQRSSEELVQLIAHFFYNGAKPACLTTTSSPEDFKSVK